MLADYDGKRFVEKVSFRSCFVNIPGNEELSAIYLLTVVSVGYMYVLTVTKITQKNYGRLWIKFSRSIIDDYEPGTNQFRGSHRTWTPDPEWSGI